MKVLIFLACLVFAIDAVSFFDLVLEEWHLFKLQHNKTFKSDVEEKFRLKIFMDNKHKIARHNARYEKGEVTYKLGLNQYSDMLHHEFVSVFNGYKKDGILKKQGSGVNGWLQGSTFIPPANVKLPDEVNWVKKGAVTPVKNQMECGSCWAFSATGCLEGQQFRKTGVLISLSEQNLVDCSNKEGNKGCEGGVMDQAFMYVQKNGGIDTEKSYPYEAKDMSCRYNPKTTGATDTGFVDIPSGDEEALKAAVATVGPISVAIDASQESFQLYSGGVYNDTNCQNDQKSLDHGVLVVGYGTDEQTQLDYWLVKNSWGDNWGDEGYIKIIRNADNLCGIATSASYALV